MQRTHRLRMVRVVDSGLEEWACPVCGRRMLVRWPPDCRKEVVDLGDEEAAHVADRAQDAPEGPAARRRLRETGVRLAAAAPPS
ncbi:hypothetical protein [Actinomadura sp. WMMB 499]|uniref:hypothetical protein n=1 Tax=Actinomadura sp. WMMB 499 TaxID=1219491 RepID=UPI001248FB4E|nr:hypothetical protein [Actinomadura sp. WMMB 499]QFG19843.1 hypothetical protein F7P10_00270 [Actinomadura sp. WMMB 499]